MVPFLDITFTLQLVVPEHEKFSFKFIHVFIEPLDTFINLQVIISVTLGLVNFIVLFFQLILVFCNFTQVPVRSLNQ